MAKTPGDRLHERVNELMPVLANGKENSVGLLRQRQGKIYQELWTALRDYETATGKVVQEGR